MPNKVSLIMSAPIGTLLLSAHSNRLAGLVIFIDGVDGRLPASVQPIQAVAHDSPVLQQAVEQLGEYFAGRRREFRLPLDLAGLPPFTRTILEVLRTVPFGATLTYGDLAAKAGMPRAARAVGGAMAANPLPIVIPCHRVVAAGHPGGYSGGGGLRTKEWLLAFERDRCRGN
jgi:methylated-DNA-[protein]-cysteine S-methyltransferase